MFAEGSVWPSANGRSMAFVARMVLDDHAALGPHQGALQLFVDRASFDVDTRSSEPPCWLLTHEPYDQVALREPPDDLPAKWRLQFSPLRAEHGWSLPEDALPSPYCKDRSKRERRVYRELIEGLEGTHVAQLGGWPRPIQHSDIELEATIASKRLDYYSLTRDQRETYAPEAQSWRLVMQIGSSSEAKMDWISGGDIFILMRDEDIAAGAWQKAWLVVQFT